MSNVSLKPGWLLRDTHRAALVVARAELEEARREVRQINDALADACTKEKVARAKLGVLERQSTDKRGE